MDFRLQALDDQRRYQSFDGAAELGDLAHNARTEITVFFRGHHENGFHIGFEPSIHERHLELVLVVGDGANAAQDGVGIAPAHIVHQKPIEEIHFHIGPLAGDFTEHFRALARGEERRLVQILEDGDDEAVEDARAAGNEVQVPVGHGIEGPRIDGDDALHAGNSARGILAQNEEGKEGRREREIE